jgi:hypothetical protein
MLTNKQQAIVDSLVNEFTKMNQPTSSAKKGLLDWDEIYSEIDAWEKTKKEIDLKNEAFLHNAQLEVDRITKMLENEFNAHFYIYKTTNNKIECGWMWCIVPQGKHLPDRVLRIDMKYRIVRIFNESETNFTNSIEQLYFENSAQSGIAHYSIEKLFEEKRVVNTFKEYLNK